MPDSSGIKLGFLGAGKMATALARGWLTAGLTSTNQCRASDPAAAARDAFASATGCQVAADNQAVVKASEVLVLAVKPQSMTSLLQEISPVIEPRHLIVS